MGRQATGDKFGFRLVGGTGETGGPVGREIASAFFFTSVLPFNGLEGRALFNKVSFSWRGGMNSDA